jgi:hypothetical protein
MYAVALLMGFISHGPVPETVELVEVNHCYNPCTGERRFIAVIYWDYYGSSQLHVREWHMLDRCQSVFHIHERPNQPFTIVRQRDGKLQIIRARRYQVTHSFFDPEEEDRKLLPVDARRPIGK